jgi:NAD(P)-dependent dehydrogenase (short-subunit alcohol dehydrogenase family)
MKTALVTGASGNMGQAVVKKFIDGGYFVIGSVPPCDKAELTFPANSFEKISVDLEREDDAQKFVQSVISKYSPIDVAILTVGGFAMGTIAETKTSDIRNQYKLNFETAYNVARHVFIEMINENNGRIFLIGSKPGLNAKDGRGVIAYSLAKSLLFRLAELMNDEAKGKNVVTSVIVPGTIDTPQNRESMPGKKYENWVKKEAIADAIYWYCGDEATAIREPVIKLYNNS